MLATETQPAWRRGSLVRFALLLATLLAALWLCTPFVQALLDQSAARVVAIWASGATPYDIDFRLGESVIESSSSADTEPQTNAHGLRLQTAGKPLGLTLRMPQDGLLPERLHAVALDAEASQPGHWKLLAFAAEPSQRATLASGRIDATHEAAEITLQNPGWRIHALQLRINLPAGAQLQLQRLRFVPAITPNLQAACDGTAREHCPRDAIRLPIDPDTALVPMLTKVDQLHQQWPGLAIELLPAAYALTQAMRSSIRAWLRWTQSGGGRVVLLLVAASLLLLSLIVALRGKQPLGISALPVLLAALLLLGAGQPGDSVSAPVFVLAAAAVLLALALSLRSPPLQLLASAAAWRDAAWFTLAGLLVLGVLGQAWRAPDLDAALRYLPWVLLQQWLLQRLIRPGIESLAADTPTVMAASALCFALLHFPNPGLMAFSAVGAAGWVWLARRHRSLLPLVLSHWLLGLAALALLSPDLLRNAEIGARFLMPR